MQQLIVKNADESKNVDTFGVNLSFRDTKKD